jgi:hypothetical protein
MAVKKIVINSDSSLEAVINKIRLQYEEHKYLNVTVSKGSSRTPTQNASMHLFCGMLADELNGAGYDFRTFVKPGYPVPFSEYLVLNYVWRPIQKALTGHDSSTKPTRKEYGLIYDTINLKMITKGIYCPWPTLEAKNEKESKQAR